MDSVNSDTALHATPGEPPVRSHHVAVTVANVEASAAFYGEHFGFERSGHVIDYDRPWFARGVGLPGASARSILLSRGTLVLELFQYTNPEGNVATVPDLTHVGASHLGLEVDDVDVTYELLSQAGADLIAAPSENEEGEHQGARWFYMRDPDGWYLEVYTLPKTVNLLPQSHG